MVVKKIELRMVVKLFHGPLVRLLNVVPSLLPHSPPPHSAFLRTQKDNQKQIMQFNDKNSKKVKEETDTYRQVNGAMCVGCVWGVCVCEREREDYGTLPMS